MPGLFEDGLPQTVFISADDTTPNSSELLYTFFTGIKPRIIDASNTSPGILIIRFNEPMLIDDTFRRTQNFTIEPLGDTPTVEVTGVTTSPSSPDSATLTFTGGGSLYQITVTGVTDAAGNPIDLNHNTYIFDISLPGGQQEQLIHLFDTVFGPIGLAQRKVTRRTVDGLVINRATDVALTKQFSQRLEAAGASIPLRSGKDGGRRR
jgi:hypothetical protein